jgi:hypothetical protein
MLASTAKAIADNATYDGRWWLSVVKSERLQFLEGYMACYLNDTDGKIKFAESGYSYEPRVTNYFQNNPNERRRSVEEIFLKMAQPPYAQPVKKLPGESWKGRYGYLDGDYWRQHQEPDRLGLIQGFLYCYSNHAKVNEGTFLKPASWYVEVISKWYGAKSEDPAEINLARIKVKIPDVLFGFRGMKPN